MQYYLAIMLRDRITIIVLVIGMIIFIANDSYCDRRTKRLTITIIFLAFAILLLNTFERIIYSQYSDNYLMLRTVMTVLEYSVRPMIIVLFRQLSQDRKYQKLMWGAAILNVFVQCLSLIPGCKLVFWYDVNNKFISGPLMPCTYVLCLLYLVILFIDSVIRYKKQHWRGEPLLWYIVFQMSVAVCVDFSKEDQISTNNILFAVFSGILFYLFYNHLVFRNEYEKKLVKDFQTQIMISQIQPHFLFNTLTTIQALCSVDAKLASDTIGRFSDYLRGNLDCIKLDRPARLEEELRHTRTYVEIERLRFPNISVEYDIQNEHINIPALSVQPLVENAIRHGVRIRENGKVVIKSYEEDGYNVVEIIDNGKGFDVNMLNSIGADHIGISNVRERVERMVNGKMLIESKIGEGTKVKLLIPKEK